MNDIMATVGASYLVLIFFVGFFAMCQLISDILCAAYKLLTK